MGNISLNNAIQILSDVDKDSIEIIPHCYDSLFDRDIPEEWIYNSILNEEPNGILYQGKNKFRVYYQHQNSNHDLILIIEIQNLKNAKPIKVITTYEQNVKRRVR